MQQCRRGLQRDLFCMALVAMEILAFARTACIPLM